MKHSSWEATAGSTNNTPALIKPEVSLPWLQEPASTLYPEPYWSSPHHQTLLLYDPSSFQWSLPFMLSNENFMFTS
jgi:hypothetical protein